MIFDNSNNELTYIYNYILPDGLKLKDKYNQFINHSNKIISVCNLENIDINLKYNVIITDYLNKLNELGFGLQYGKDFCNKQKFLDDLCVSLKVLSNLFSIIIYNELY